MTDVRKIPWRLPQGFEGLRYFWDEFIKKLGADIELRAGSSDEAELMSFFYGN